MPEYIIHIHISDLDKAEQITVVFTMVQISVVFTGIIELFVDAQ